MTKRLDIQIKDFTSRIEDLLKESVKRDMMLPLAQEAERIVLKRTRLGYGVSESMGDKSKLRASGPGGGFSPRYLKTRKLAKSRGQLDSTSNTSKLNLTFTGEMLRSTKVITAKDGKIVIAPSGLRRDGKKNADIARYNADAGRIYLNVSRLEFQQLFRFYRKAFTDLGRKLKVLRRR
jgi:hypothetical protein